MLNDAVTFLLDCQKIEAVPTDGRLTVDEMPEWLQGLMLTCVRISWSDDEGQEQSAWLPVQTENLDDLLSPEEFCRLYLETVHSVAITAGYSLQLREQPIRRVMPGHGFVAIRQAEVILWLEPDVNIFFAAGLFVFFEFLRNRVAMPGELLHDV
jgi:hypothetical protein